MYTYGIWDMGMCTTRECFVSFKNDALTQIFTSIRCWFLLPKIESQFRSGFSSKNAHNTTQEKCVCEKSMCTSTFPLPSTHLLKFCKKKTFLFLSFISLCVCHFSTRFDSCACSFAINVILFFFCFYFFFVLILARTRIIYNHMLRHQYQWQCRYGRYQYQKPIPIWMWYVCKICRILSSSMIEIYSAALLFTLKPPILACAQFFFLTFSTLVRFFHCYFCYCYCYCYAGCFVFFSFFCFHFWHFNCCPVQRARSNATISIHLLYT